MLEALAVIVKGLGYAAAFSAAGTVIARASLAGGGFTPSIGPTLLMRWAGVMVAVTAVGTAFLFFLRLGGQGDAATLHAIFLSPLGLALGLQMAGGLWVALFAHRSIALIGAAWILLAFGVVGHSASRGLLTSVTVSLHVTAAAWWFGGLWVVLGASRLPSMELSLLVSRFSRQAVWIVAVLLVAALATAAFLLEFHVDPWLAYQQGLLTKLGLTAALLVLAGINKLILTPRLAVEGRTRIWLRWMIAAEMLLFTGAIATTAYLTTYLSPHEEKDAAHGHEGQVQVSGPISVVDPWAPAMPGSAQTGAGYMAIVNNQPVVDRLIAASSPWAEHVTLHVSILDGNVARMRELVALPIPAQGRVVLEPGRYHLMFAGLYVPFVAGDVVPLELVFERAGRVEVALKVLPLGDRPLDDHRH